MDHPLGSGAVVNATDATMIDLGISDAWIAWFNDAQTDAATVALLASDIDDPALRAVVDRFPNERLVHRTIHTEPSAQMRSGLDARVPSRLGDVDRRARCTDDHFVSGSSKNTTLRRVNVANSLITILVESRDDTRVLRIAGELDVASRSFVTCQCTQGRARAVVVDLADLTFMDCGGYRAFDAARATLQRQGRTLTLVGAVGEPRRLLDLILEIGSRR